MAPGLSDPRRSSSSCSGGTRCGSCRDARLPAYNEHLLTDVGGFYLGFAVLFVWAAASLSRQLVLASCASWALVQLLHFVYHATHLDGFGVAQAIVQTVGLAATLALPIAASLLLLRSRPDPHQHR